MAHYCPKWKRVVEEMMQERNPFRLSLLAYDLEDAIWNRQQELNGEELAADEPEMAEASEWLYNIRVQKLGFPDGLRNSSYCCETPSIENGSYGMSRTAYYLKVTKDYLQRLERSLAEGDPARQTIGYVLSSLLPELEDAIKDEMPSLNASDKLPEKQLRT